MPLIEINWNPNRKELRNFGIVAFIASALLSLLLYLFKGLGIQWAAIITAAGLIIFLTSMIFTKLTRFIYLGLILVTLPIGYMVSFILLALFYFLLLTPLGLLFRLIGRDSLCRKFDARMKSYWLTHQSPDNTERYFHQF